MTVVVLVCFSIFFSMTRHMFALNGSAYVWHSNKVTTHKTQIRFRSPCLYLHTNTFIFADVIYLRVHRFFKSILVLIIMGCGVSGHSGQRSLTQSIRTSQLANVFYIYIFPMPICPIILPIASERKGESEKCIINKQWNRNE